jgi:hypothetical protein
MTAWSSFTPTRLRAAKEGRYQIVNGTPELTRNIMLLDTWTGNTWIVCEDKEAASKSMN